MTTGGEGCHEHLQELNWQHGKMSRRGRGSESVVGVGDGPQVVESGVRGDAISYLRVSQQKILSTVKTGSLL